MTAIPFGGLFLPGIKVAAAEGLQKTKRSIHRVRPGEANWPNQDSWNKLKEQVAGNLLAGGSPLDACKKDAPDSASCRELLKNLDNPYFVGDTPGFTQTTGWVDGWTTAPSSYVVAAKNTSDVVSTVNFARENNLRLVVRGGAHSYKGSSNCTDSLMVWTRAMNDIQLHDAFVPKGCEGKLVPQPAVAIGAGAMWVDVYDAVTTKAGRFVQGGGCATVGVAGLISGGGFGSFSKHYGMAAASLLQAEIVTADGAVRIVNEASDPDLFWAIKGGGGGSFGVITQITLKTHVLPPRFGGVQMDIQAHSDDAYKILIDHFISFYEENLFNPHWGEQAHFQPNNILEIRMVVHGLNEQEEEETWKPFLDWVKSSPADYSVNKLFIGSMESHHWWDADWRKQNLSKSVIMDPRPGASAKHFYWDGNQSEVCIFLHGYESLWLPKSLLQASQRRRLGNALFAGSRIWKLEMHFNKGLAGAPAEAIEAARNTAMNPLVLDAFALVIIAGGKRSMPGFPGHEPNLKDARKDAHEIDQSMNELRKIVPNVGAYVSESDYFEKSWQHSFWGANYPRLQAVKEKYDPEGLFFVHQGVGTEKWSADGFVRQQI